jgi:hypothetical protein
MSFFDLAHLLFFHNEFFSICFPEFFSTLAKSHTSDRSGFLFTVLKRQQLPGRPHCIFCMLSGAVRANEHAVGVNERFEKIIAGLPLATYRAGELCWPLDRNPANGGLYLKSIETAARDTGTELIVSAVHDHAGIDEVFAAMAQGSNGGVLVMPNIFMVTHRERREVYSNPPRLIANPIKLCLNRRPRSLTTAAVAADDPCKLVVPFSKIPRGSFHRRRKL